MASRLLDRVRSIRTTRTAQRSESAVGPLLSSELMASLQRLAISAPRVQRGTFAGEHRSRRRGTSPEFADFKSYSPGDDIRRVDWNLYARFDELFVRVSEVTTDLTIHMVVDSSSSMDWSLDPEVPTKFRFAQQIAAALGYVSLWQFDRIKISPFAESRVSPLGPVQGRTQIRELLDYLDGCTVSGIEGVASTLYRYAHRSPTPGLLVVLSDLLSDDVDLLAQQVTLLRSKGWEVVMVHVLDRSELQPELLFAAAERHEPTTLLDSESGEKIMMMPGSASYDRYLAEMRPWLDEIETRCRTAGVTYLRLTTDQPIDTIVLKLLHDLGILV